MKRFYFGDDEHHDDEDESESEDPRFSPEFFSMAQFPFEAESDLIGSSIKICEGSIFWKFYKLETKLSKIKKVYDFLQSLRDGVSDMDDMDNIIKEE